MERPSPAGLPCAALGAWRWTTAGLPQRCPWAAAALPLGCPWVAQAQPMSTGSIRTRTGGRLRALLTPWPSCSD